MRYRVWLLGSAIALALSAVGCSLIDGGQPTGTPGTGTTTPTATPSATSSAGATSTPGTTATGGKVTLELKPKVGTTLRYRVTSRIVNDAVVNGKQQKITMSQTIVFAQKTIKVAENGDSTVRLTYQSASARVGGKTVKLPQSGKTVTFIVSSKGQVRDVKSLGGIASSEGEDYRRILDDVPAPLPKKPVGVGESWETTSDIRLPDGSGTLSMTTNYRLTGFRKIGRERTAVVKSTFTSPAKITLARSRFILDVESSARGSGTEYFAIDRGRMLRSTGDARVFVDQAFHASGLGLPWVNSSSRIRVWIRADLIR